MPQYATDFAGNTVGTAPPTGWTPAWDATTNWDVVTGPYAGWITQGSNAQDALLWDEVGSVTGDCQIAVLFRSSFGSGSQGGVVIHASNSATSGYAVALSGTGNELAPTRLDSGAENILSGGAFTWTLNTDYWIRVERLGNTLRGRAWADGGSEPGTWAFSLTDSTYTAGRLGLFARNLNGDKTWKFVGVGTGGDAAPLSLLGGGGPVSGYLASDLYL